MGGAPDLLVLGAGPAGVGAALAGASNGLRTVLLDEAAEAGGQIYRALRPGLTRRPGADLGPDARAGDHQRRLLAESPVQCVFGARVWNVGADLRVDAVGPDGPCSWRPRALVVAVGATERVVPFPGWTLPGVIGLAAATILLKSQHVLPGERTLVAGCGPLLAAVAAGILKAGGTVAAIIDLDGPADWLRALPNLSVRPALALRGLGWMRAIWAAEAPILFRHGIRVVSGAAGALQVEAAPVNRDRGWKPGGRKRRFVVDAVAVGHGLTPATEVTRLLRARHVFRPAWGGWTPECDADGRTSIPGLYVAGDGAGVAGAVPSFLAGRLAGLAAACDLAGGANAPAGHEMASLRRVLARKRRAGRALAALAALRPAHVAGIPPETVVCRCEDVTRAQIEAAVAAGAHEVNQVKAWTRCGMGACQGRMCGEVVAELVAAHVGGREAAGSFTGRAPLRPVGLAALTGSYAYADIPIPASAPL